MFAVPSNASSRLAKVSEQGRVPEDELSLFLSIPCLSRFSSAPCRVASRRRDRDTPSRSSSSLPHLLVELHVRYVSYARAFSSASETGLWDKVSYACSAPNAHLPQMCNNCGRVRSRSQRCWSFFATAFSKSDQSGVFGNIFYLALPFNVPGLVLFCGQTHPHCSVHW